MASISKQPNGRKTIQFVGVDGKRRSIRLGGVSQKIAEAVKVRVEQLAAAAISGHVCDAETIRWMTSLDTAMADKLAAVGLVPKREAATLDAFIIAFIENRTDVKPATRRKYRSTQRVLVPFFGAECKLRDITPGDADDWRMHLVGKKLAENTVRKHTAVAKVFFTAAVRKRLIASNPFADLKATIQPNPSRFYFVTRDEAASVLEWCPDAQWRLLFALSRYGGLRCPSEHLAIRWGDVDWGRDRIYVRSPKTEHHVGGESRMVPIFPELRPYLEECDQLAGEREECVITRYRDTNTNLRTQLLRIIKRAGLNPWPKLFQNLRSTRQTELEEEFPSHVVCAWMGNSRPVAAKHYLQVTEEHFLKAVQNPVQQPAVSGRTVSQRRKAESEKPLVLQGKAIDCDTVRKHKMAEAGLEPAHRLPDTGF